MAVSEQLDARYGRSRDSKRRELIIGLIAAGAFIIVFAAWAIWAGFDNDSASLKSTDTAFSVVDDRTIDVSFTVSSEPGQAVSCAIQSLNETFTVIGWKVVSYAPSEARTTAHTERVHTLETPNTGLIYRCWLT